MHHLALTLTEVTEAADLFAARYASTAGEQLIGRVSTNWQAFRTRVEQFAFTGHPLRNIALKLIHRFDAEQMQWFPTVQICDIAGPTGKPDEFFITCQDMYFDVQPDGQLSPNYTDADGANMTGEVWSRRGIAYFDDVTDDGNLLNPLTYPSGVVMPWLEYELLFLQNNTADRSETQLFDLQFTCGSHQENPSGGYADVEFPHTIMLQLNYAGSPCLDDNQYGPNIFYNKAANYNTLCPPKCKLYIAHPDLARLRAL